MHQLKLRPIYFDMIKSGDKIYEIRLNDEKRKNIKVGDTIIFKKEPELTQTLSTIVEKLILFNSFKDMAKSLPLNEVGFPTQTADEVISIYHEFYSLIDENKYGVIAIKINLVSV